MIFQLSRSIKDEVVEYLRRIFILHERGDLFFTNGVYHIQFTHPPKAQTIDAWEKPGGNYIAPGTREYPVVLVGEVSGPLKAGGVGGANTHLGSLITMTDEDPDGNLVLGGEAVFTLNLTCVAQSSIERDNLTDIVCIYLAHPLFKRILSNKLAVQIGSDPRLGSQSSVEDVATDFKLYQSELSMDFAGFWRETVDKLEALEKAIVTLYVDP